MGKLQLALLALLILGLVGAVNSITNQSTLDKEKGFLNGVLSLIGLTYKPEPEPAREFDFVPGKVTSEVSKLTPDNLKATPSAKTNQNPITNTQSTVSTPRLNLTTPPAASNQYNFSFSNEIPVPPITPNGQTLGTKTQKTPPVPELNPSIKTSSQKPPIPPVSPNQNQNRQSLSTNKKSSDIIDAILNFLKI